MPELQFTDEEELVVYYICWRLWIKSFFNANGDAATGSRSWGRKGLLEGWIGTSAFFGREPETEGEA